LQPNTEYHYRVRFLASNGQTYLGADQTFRTLPDGQATVGNGQAASCTAAALTAALSGADNILFDCGPVPVTITLSSAMWINSDTSFDGGNKITLAAPTGDRHFIVEVSSLILRDITLTGGSSSGCGGSVYVDESGYLVTEGARFIGNTSANNGGALCVSQIGYAYLTQTLFLDNHASSGGAIWNYGTVEMFNSSISENTANPSSGIGGGVANENGSTFVAAYSLFDGNSAANGGGLYGGTVIYHSTLSGNYASLNGGGIYGDPFLSNTTISGNTASSCTFNCEQGGGVYGNAILQNSILSGNYPQNCPTGFLTPVTFTNGYNLVSDASCDFTATGDRQGRNPMLGPLQDNGGPTRTHALLPGSPAIDQGSNALCVSHTGSTSGVTDQRGVARPVDSNQDGSAVCDIGAFEAPVYRMIYLPMIIR
jgi:parallel beta-helix repeat protein/predicted outer membrane repeat protein